MKSYSLHEVNEFIRRILALNLPDALWIRCEIAQVSEARGHHFLELVQKAEESDEIIAQASAVIWQGNYRKLRAKIGLIINDLLQDGIEVQFKAKIDFNERYGLKLIVEDIDPTYTLGKLEMRRQQTIEALQQADLMGRNALVSLSPVLQQIAVVSSERAAGYQDFTEHLKNNPYNYRFHYQIFKTAMQGDQVQAEMLKQLKLIEHQKERFDCVVIIRGGGARLDLAAFDSLELCRAVAQFPLPVFTGIGHDVDETVLDMVAYSALKTPTAVADFIMNRNLLFESALVNYGQRLRVFGLQRLKNQAILLQNLQQKLQLQSSRKLGEANRMLDFIKNQIPDLIKYKLQDQRHQLDKLEKVVQLMSVEATLKRGFTITQKDGKILCSAEDVKSGDSLTTRFMDGEIQSKAD